MRPSRHLVPALLLTALLALVVAGCGGGGDETTDTTAEKTTETKPSLTKEELIKQGDGVCAEVNAAVGSVGSSAADAQSQTTSVANLYINMVESLENLGEPREDAAAYKPFMEAAEELAKVEGEVKLAAEREDSVALGEAATRAAPILEEFQTQAGVYGFEQCSQGPGEVTTAPSTGGASEEAEVEEGGIEAEEGVIEEVVPEEEFVPEEEVAPEGGGAGAIEEVAPEEGGGEEENSGGGVGPG
jgi:hypothetical protein